MSYLPDVTVEVFIGTWQTVSNVQSLQLDKGRVKISDEWRPGTGTITGRRNDLLPSNIVIGTGVRIYVGAQGAGGTGVFLYYRVADLNLNYGIISSLDTWQLTLEDTFAYLGRANVDISWASGTVTSTAFATLCGLVGLGADYYTTGKSTMSAQTLTNANAQDVLQTIINTEQGAVYADGLDLLTFYGRNWQANVGNINFTDTGAGSYPVRYDQVTFRSMADNYADQVIVYPRGSSEVVTGDGIYSYNLDSYSFDTGQATNLAQYVQGTFSVQNSTPSSVSFQLNEQSNLNWMFALAAPANAQLTLRGTLYNSIVLGCSITGDPANVRFTFNLASSDFFSFLTLDNTVFGTLDNNKLGY